jgi:hypothetical protein
LLGGEQLFPQRVQPLQRQPEVVLGTWRAARVAAPDMTEDEARLAQQAPDLGDDRALNLRTWSPWKLLPRSVPAADPAAADRAAASVKEGKLSGDDAGFDDL